MASFSIVFSPSVHKDLRTLPASVVRRVMQRIEDLAKDPFPVQAAKLSGSEQLYRIRVGAYRVIYEVDTEAAQITIHHVRHRRDAYRHR